MLASNSNRRPSSLPISRCGMWKGYVALILGLCSAALLQAQSTATISGSIVDSSGARVAGARVTITNILTQAVRAVVSDDLGNYQVGSLAPGHYRLEVEAPGFKKMTQDGITLQVDERLRVDGVLQVGEVSETVSVSAEGVAVNTLDATLRAVVDAKRMADLPLNGRSPLQLMLLAPGVLPSPPAGIGGSFQPSGQQFVSSSGSKANGINFVLDGGDNQDTYRSVANSFPNPDILQEFSVQTNSYSPEFGGRAGGVVNAVTKSGTNELHGTLFEFLRNNALNAQNFFALQDDGLKRNQYGGTVGGPVFIPKLYDGRNRTFFFFGYQDTKIRQRPTNATARVLTERQRRGDFGDLLDGRGNLIPIRDPETGLPFPNNVIPSNRLDPVFQNFLKEVPVAQEANGTVRFAVPNISNETQYNIRVDQNLNNSDRFFVRFFKSNFEQPNTGIPGNILSFRNRLLQRATNATLAYNKTFSPTLLGEAAFTFNRSAGLRGDVAPFTWQELGANVPAAGTSNDLLFFMNNYFNVVLFGDTPLVRNNFQYKGSLSHIKGRHNLRGGFNIVRRQFNIPIVNVQFHGRYTFSQALTGDNAADAILGKPSSFLQDTGFRVALRQTDWTGWVNDEIRLNRRMTFNIGVRYEPFLPWVDRWNPLPQVAQFSPGVQSGVYPNAPRGLLFYGDPGVPEGMAESALDRLAPRVGLAIDPFGDGKTSIRIGYGIFYDTLLPTEQIQQYASQIPTFTAVAAFNNPPSTRDPYAGRPVPFPAELPRPRNFVFPTPVNTSILMYAPGFTNPYTQQWNLTLERQILSSTITRATYQGSRGLRLPINIESNPATFIPGASSRANVEQRRPFGPAFSSIKSTHSFGTSDYHGLVLSLDRRFSQGFSLLASYTFSKNLDHSEQVNSANSPTVNNPYNPLSNRGRADADRPHAFVASYVWEMPRLQNSNAIARHLFGGWQNNGIISLYSGLPFSVISGIDNSLSGVGSDRADLVGNPDLGGGRSKGEKIARYFNTSAFVENAIGTFGTSGRNIVRGPGIATLDWSLFKNIPLAEKQALQFRAEFFNLFNRTNLGNPVANVRAGAFGRIQSAGDPRIVQFALKIIF